MLKTKAPFFLYLCFQSGRVDRCTDARIFHTSVSLGVKEAHTRNAVFSTRSILFVVLHVTCGWLWRGSERVDWSFSCGRHCSFSFLSVSSFCFVHFSHTHFLTSPSILPLLHNKTCPLLLPTALLSSSTTSRLPPPTLLVSSPDRSPSSPVLGNPYLSSLSPLSYFFVATLPLILSYWLALVHSSTFFLLHSAHIVTTTVGRGQPMNRTKRERRSIRILANERGDGEGAECVWECERLTRGVRRRVSRIV